MAISNLGKRLIAGFTILPVLFLSICLLPYLNYFAFFIIIVLVCFFGLYEMNVNILKGKEHEVSPLSYLALLLPIAEYLENLINNKSINVNLNVNIQLTSYTLALIFGIIATEEIFYGVKDNFTSSISRLSKTVLNVIYPGFLSIFLVKLIFLPYYQNWYICFFLVLVFSTDTFAYFSGMLFGKNNKGYFKVSPNKSIAGYVGGIIIPGIIGLLAPIVFKEKFLFSPLAGFIIGIVTALFSCIGDLVESMLKRSSQIKDSGKIIPGRGGMLDSIDSIIFSAPFFIFLIDIFLKIF